MSNRKHWKTLKVFAVSAGLTVAGGGSLADKIPFVIPAMTDSWRISVTVDAGLVSNRRLPLRIIEDRRRLHAGEELSLAALQALANRQDGLAAQKLVRKLIAEKGIAEETASDIAYYSAIAVGSGRIWTLPQMIQAMERLEPDTEPKLRVRKYIATLYPHAWSGNTMALEAVVQFNGPGKLFGDLSDRTLEKIVKQAEKAGDGRIELLLGLRLLEQPTLSLEEFERAEHYLKTAHQSHRLPVKTVAGNLLTLLQTHSETNGVVPED